MKSIENVYTNYDDLVQEFGEEKIEERFQEILEEMLAFIQELELQEYVIVNEMALMHAILDYFSDIYRLKAYQGIEHVNEIKIKAYESFWLLQRKALQIIKEMEDDHMLYINEKFVLSRLVPFMLQDKVKEPLSGDDSIAFKNFLDTLYYFMKFRRCDPQAFELMLLAFRAGELLHR